MVHHTRPFIRLSSTSNASWSRASDVVEPPPPPTASKRSRRQTTQHLRLQNEQHVHPTWVYDIHEQQQPSRPPSSSSESSNIVLDEPPIWTTLTLSRIANSNPISLKTIWYVQLSLLYHIHKQQQPSRSPSSPSASSNIVFDEPPKASTLNRSRTINSYWICLKME